MIFWDNVKSLFNTGSQCVFCGDELPLDEKICEECLKDERQNYIGHISQSDVSYVYNYGGVIRNLLHSLKYNDDISGAYYAAAKMAETLKNFDINIKDCIIAYVPVHKNRLRSRGFDQCEVIAREISRSLHIKYYKLFERVKNTKPQFDLNSKERAENMCGAFEYVGDVDLSGKTIILIDDICTTGSTLKECAEKLPQNVHVMPYVFAKE